MSNVAYEYDESEDEKIRLTIPQSQFLASACKYPLFLAGFGSGKSSCMAISAVNDLSYPGANVAVYAPTFDLLSLIIVPYIEELLTNNEIPYKHNKNTKRISVEDHGDIIYRSMDDPSRIVGYQVFRSHLDELDTLPTKKAQDVWRKVQARNRQKVFIFDKNNRKIPQGLKNGQLFFKTYKNRVSAYTTPEGFKFCYERWEKNPVDGYQIFRASTYSNAHNLPDDYIDTLRASYPPELIDAYIEGRFVNLIGGRCYPKFDRVLNNSNETVQNGETLYVGMDFNVMQGAAIIHVMRDGLPIAVDEIHNAYDTSDQIAILKERYKGHRIEVYPDAAGRHRTSSNTVETDIAQLYSAGFFVKENFCNPAIKDRVFSLSAMICNAKGERRYKVNVNKCPEFTLCLEQQIWGENGLPDKSAGLDHKPDAAGYFIYEKFPIQRESAGSNIVMGNY